jgi:precorrin-2/cobalt-factor-2 C20-methyltransferase
MRPAGKLYAIGVGPGDPELLTLKARRILSEVPLIFIPQKSTRSDSLAYTVIKQWTGRPGQKIEPLIFPMSQEAETLAFHHTQAASKIMESLAAGLDCAFINIGDSLLYGTFIYILQILQKQRPDIAVEVIPGISSVNASAAAALMPLTSDDERLAVLSAETDDVFIRRTLLEFDTVVFLKVSLTFDRLLKLLDELQLTRKAVLVRHCSTDRQEIVRDISTLKGRSIDYFSMLLVRRKA